MAGLHTTERLVTAKRAQAQADPEVDRARKTKELEEARNRGGGVNSLRFPGGGSMPGASIIP
jgi:hypothetical protein